MGSPDFAKSFEHFILMELLAYRSYRQPELDIRFLRTSTGVEVDFVLGDMATVIEVKGSARVHDGDLRALRSVQREFAPHACVLVCTETEPRRVEGGIEILPWEVFLARLWSGDLTD